MRTLTESIEGEYRRYKRLGENAIRQLSDAEVAEGDAGSNSVAIVVWHVAGNLKSRFTDFLTSDGEKPWRNREAEFASRPVSQADVLAKWEDGWAVLLGALAPLTDADLLRSVRIRGEAHSVIQALHRSLTHTAYHVGQIVYRAKALRGSSWQYLSIPPGQSDAYNRSLARERRPAGAGEGAEERQDRAR